MFSDKGKRLQEVLLDVLHKIQTCRLDHWHFKETKAKLELALKGKKNLIFLFGTTGVGKGVLVETLKEELNVPVQDDCWHLRAISCKAPSPHGNSFSWKGFWIGVLEAAFDPFPEDKVDREETLVGLHRKIGFSVTRHELHRLWRATTSAIKDRGIQVIFVDETQNFVVNEGGYRFQNRLRVIRDFGSDASGDPIAGQKSECKIVLVSTPEILEEVIAASSEVVRRMKVVVFPRYTLDGGIGGKEYRRFQSLVRGILELFPEEFRPKLSTDNILSLQMDCMGCIGNLINWFVDAINYCLAEGAESLEWLHFEKVALSNAEIEALSMRCSEDERVILKVTKRDGCGLARIAILKAEEIEGSETASAANVVKEGAKPKKVRVGEQKPVRHRKTGS